MVMTSQPEQQRCVQSPPRTFILLPCFFCHHPLSSLSAFLLTLFLILGLVTASKIVESRDTFLKNTALPHPYFFTRTTTTTTMQTLESVSKGQPRSLRQTHRKTPLFESGHSVQSHSSYLVNSENTVFFEDSRRQTQFNTKAADTRSVENSSIDQRLSSDFSDVVGDIKYATPQLTWMKGTNYSSALEKTTVPTYLNNATTKVAEFLNDHSLSLKTVLMPNHDSSRLMSSRISTITSSYSLHSDSSADDSSVPYSNAVQVPQSKHLDPCHLSEDALCRNSEESTAKIPGSNSPSPTDLSATNYSALSLSFASSASSSITYAQSEGRVEHSTSPKPVDILKLFYRETENSSKISTVSGSTLPSSSLVLLSEPARNSETTYFEDATVDSASVLESPFGKNSFSENEKYWIYDYRSSAESTPRTSTEAKPPDLVRTNKRNTANFSSASSQQSVHPVKGPSVHLERITVLGLFDMTTRTGERLEGRSELAAARLAVRHINERQLLAGYQLELITNDTKVRSVV